MNLDVIIATYRPEGIQRVAAMDLPPIEGIGYIVSWQEHENAPIPATLMRNDVRIYRFDEKGVSKNRNNAIRHSKADIVLVTDDDTALIESGLRQIRQIFERNEALDVVTFQSVAPNSPRYPEKPTELKFRLPSGYWVRGIDIAFRRKIFDKVKFDERFGPNSGMFDLSEDEIFHLKARKSGLKCMFYPVTVARHEHDSSGERHIRNPRALQSLGVVIGKSYPFSWMARAPLKAYRLSRAGQSSLLPALAHISIGAVKSLFIKL